MNKRSMTFILVALSLLGACAELDSVLFATGTQIGIDADTKPPKASIGYDREEAIIGPNYKNLRRGQFRQS